MDAKTLDENMKKYDAERVRYENMRSAVAERRLKGELTAEEADAEWKRLTTRIRTVNGQYSPIQDEARRRASLYISMGKYAPYSAIEWGKYKNINRRQYLQR